MNKEEIEDILEELHLVRPEILKPKAKKLFEAIMSIADERDELQQENKQLKDNWNKLKKYLINDINNRNGNRVVEYEDGRKASETISPIYTLMEDKSKTMKKVLDKMQEIEKSDSNE